MFTLKGMRQLHGWTHRSLDVLLEHVSTLPPELFSRELDGFGLGSVRDTLVHVLECEAAWVDKLREPAFVGWRMAEWSCADYPTAQHLREPKRQVMADTRSFLDGLTQKGLNTELELRWPPGVGERRSPALVLHHVMTHAFHHKGQVAAMCRLLGHPAPDTDLIRPD